MAPLLRFLVFQGILPELKKKEETLVRVNHQLNLLSEITRHDILNKMSVILGYLTLYRKKSPDPAVLELIDKLEPPTSVIRSLIEETKIYQDLGTHEPRWHDLDSHYQGSACPSDNRDGFKRAEHIRSCRSDAGQGFYKFAR